MTARLAHRTRGGFRGLMIAAVAAALLLGARGKTADAAPPTLSASENPVVIAAPASTKAITLAYNLNGSLAKALLTVDEVGGPTLLSTAVGAAPGSVPLTVTYGKSYKAQLVDASTKSPVATLQFTTKRPDPNNPGGQELITSSNIIPHGTYTEVAMMANQPAMFAVTASTDKPDAGGNFAHIDSSAITFAPQTSWTGMLPNLKPNTTYYYVITAKNIGYTSGTYEQSTFKTRTRRVEVLFETLHVTDDSDPFGSCECIFLFKAGAEPAQDYPDDTINDGWTVTPNVKVAVNNAPDSVMLRVTGLDDDEFGLPVCGIPGEPLPNSGSDKCYEWSSASKSIDVAVAGLGEAFAGTFSIAAHGPLEFTISGTFTVSYV